jgi:hypothetical protein
VLRSPCITASSWLGAGLVAAHLSRALSSPLEGCGVEEGQEQAAQCQGMTPTIRHSTRTASGMAA